MSTEQKAGFSGTLDKRPFDEFLDAVDAVVDEAIVRITDGGIESSAVDPANVGMVEVYLDTDAFAEFSAGEQAFGIGTRMRELFGDREDGEVELEYDPGTRKLGLAMGRYSYTHATIDPESLREEPTIPEMDLNFDAEMDIGRLREAVEWFDEFTDRVRIGYDSVGERFWMKADERSRSGKIGTDDGAYEVDRHDLGYVWEAGEADSTFSLDYLRDIVGAVPEGRTVTLRVGEEFPLELSYEILQEGSEQSKGGSRGRVKFMQAPRIVSD